MSTPDKNLDGAVKTEAGVELNGAVLQPVVEQCANCERIRLFGEQQFCGSYSAPARKWSSGRCNFATNLKTETTGKGKAKVNPLKASKRAAKGR